MQLRLLPHGGLFSEIYLLNRHAQVVEDSKIVLKITLKTLNSNEAETQISIKQAL